MRENLIRWTGLVLSPRDAEILAEMIGEANARTDPLDALQVGVVQMVHGGAALSDGEGSPVPTERPILAASVNADWS